jgi:hypothetical protein
MNAMLTPDVADRLLDLVRAAAPDAAGVGLPGVRTAGTANELSQILTKQAGIPVRVADDGITTTLGAFGGQPGIVVHAGTGSGACGWNGTRWARAGGHGYLLGDEGSAYWLGRAAVSAALAWEDGAGGSEAIHEAVTGAAGCPMATLVRSIYNHSSERTKVTVFAPIVSGLAAKDPVARSLAHQAAAHLAALAETLRRRLGPLPDTPPGPAGAPLSEALSEAERGSGPALPVCGTGGVLSAPVIWERFAELTGAVRPLAPPEVGAALLGASVLGDAPPPGVDRG